MSSPCGGCPPHCKVCIFASRSVAHEKIDRVVVDADTYGCVRADGGAVVLAHGQLGMMRGEAFHPVTAEGANFLRNNGNVLAAHC